MNRDSSPRRGPLTAALLCLLGVLVVTSAAWGQPRTDLDVEKALRRGGSTRSPGAVERSTGAVRPPEAAPIQAEVQWGLWRETEVEEARGRHFTSFMRLSRELGQTPRTWHALAMLEETSSALDKGDYAQAEARLKDARLADPALPAPEFAQVAVELKRSPTAVLPAWRALKEGWRKGATWLPARYAAQAEGLQLLVWGLGLMAATLVVIVVLRHLRLLAADAARLLPRGAAVGQLQLLGLLLIAAPGLLTGSPILSLLAGLALLGAYMAWSERLAALLILAGIAALPTAASLRDSALHFPGSEVYEVWSASATPCDDACLARLARPGREGEDPTLDAARRLTRANRLLTTTRTDYKEVVDLLQPLAADATLDARVRAVARNNLAIAQVMAGAPAEAPALLRDALGDAPERWEPHLNLARIYDLESRDTEAQASVQEAIRIGGGDAAERSSEDERTVNLWFEILPAPPSALAQVWDRRSFDGAATASTWRPAFGATPVSQAVLLAGAAAGVLVLLTLAGMALRAARRCQRCGLEMFRRHDSPREDQDGTCRACRTCFGSGGQVTYHERVAHEEIAQRWVSRARWTLRLGNLLTPGLGAALRGGALGLTATLLIAFGVGALIGGRELPPRVGALTSLAWDGMSQLGWVFVLLGVLLGGVAVILGDPTPPEKIGARSGERAAVRRSLS